ncbi:hypothetical protein DFQ26_001423 [Actinomortierella ambigua]|nr:hypothetical protein DFQ26_001423 [Actinomortierella ambigua]
MRITNFITVATAILAVTSALPAPVSKTYPPPSGFSVGLTHNKKYKLDTRAELIVLNQRYPSLGLSHHFDFLNHLPNDTDTSGPIPVATFLREVEYYATVQVGTPGQALKMNFDTGSSDIWLSSTNYNAPAQELHLRFDASKSTTFQEDLHLSKFQYGDGSSVLDFLGSDIVKVCGISVRQAVDLSMDESARAQISPADGTLGLGLSPIHGVDGKKSFIENAIQAKALVQPVFSVYLPPARARDGGLRGEVLFGGINHKHYSGELTYVPITQPDHWVIEVEDILFNNQSLGIRSQEGIIDTGTALVLVDTATAYAIHSEIPGAAMTEAGWAVPCSLLETEPTGKMSFKMGGKYFDVPLVDLVTTPVGHTMCQSGIQGGSNKHWILGNAFLKNNYCVFDQGLARIGIAPIEY